MGLLVGILIGAVAALLYAPKAGGDLRVDLRQRSDEFKRRTDDLQRVAQKVAGDAQTKGRELFDDVRQEWSSTSATDAGGRPSEKL